MMLLGVLGMIAIPRFPSMIAETQLNEAAGEMVSALHYARNLAIRYQRPFGWRGNPGGDNYSVFDNQYKTDPNPPEDADPRVTANGVVLHPVEKNWYAMDFDDSKLYKGVDITSVPPSMTVLFYPDGHSSEAESIIVLSYAGNSRNIVVNGMTGRVRVQ
jgi:Tfp pilus assembly protein FimT